MPLYYRKEINAQCQIGIWDATETLASLTILCEQAQINLPEFTETLCVSRRKEKLCIRLLLKYMLGEKKWNLEYDEYGKPFLKYLQKNISISHTGQYAAVCIHEKKKAGIDIEKISPRINKIKNRFLNPIEKQNLSENFLNEQLLIMWGAKECAFKIYSKGGIDFKNMLAVENFNYGLSGHTSVNLRKNNISYDYPVWWERTGHLMLVYGWDD